MPQDFARDWPELTEARDGPTIATLHLFSQVVGKIAVALLPWRNHGWHVALHLHPRGMRTETVHGPTGAFEAGLDLVGHQLTIVDTAGTHQLPLTSTCMADFYRRTMALLVEAGHAVEITPMSNEISPPIDFRNDTTPRVYDPESAARLLRVLLAADDVFRQFRSSFLGKVSPVHFFWGSFDLAVTRFSGRSAPMHPGGVPHLPDAITREAYSHEVSSAGFWPGGAMGGVPMFYSYAYPPPDGFAAAKVEPAAARWDTALGEFVLDYETLRSVHDPAAALLAFLTTTYTAAAELGHWDRGALECPVGRPRTPRKLG